MLPRSSDDLSDTALKTQPKNEITENWTVLKVKILLLENYYLKDEETGNTFGEEITENPTK